MPKSVIRKIQIFSQPQHTDKKEGTEETEH